MGSKLTESRLGEDRDAVEADEVRWLIHRRNSLMFVRHRRRGVQVVVVVGVEEGTKEKWRLFYRLTRAKAVKRLLSRASIIVCQSFI
jgi:hypothetical protein